MAEKKVASTKSNLVFNFAGRIWVALTGVLFVPVYIHYLGIEVYGIIGFFIGLQTFLSLLDLGISPTLNREIARLSAFEDKAREMRDLSRTLEILCLAVALTTGVIALSLSPLVANYWLQPEKISPAAISQALMLMSVSFIFQWMINFYTGGLMGLQRQKLFNLLNAVGVTFRAVGAILILAFVSPTIQAFLIWQGFATFLLLLMMAIAYWKSLPAAESKAKFRSDLLRGVWQYAAGMTRISLVALILTQTDKIVLSRLLTLENFGYYTLAATLAGMAVGTITGSVTGVYFPQFSQLAALEDEKSLRTIYHRSAQVMSVFLIPAMTVIGFFSFEILLLWTKNEKIAQNTWLLLTLSAIGWGLHGLMHIPYFMQLANGLTKLAFWQNVVAIILLIPFMIFTTLHYGAIGGVLTWAILNLLYVLVGMQIMHRMLLRGELKKWYLEDTGLPLIATFACALALRFLFPRTISPIYIFVGLSVMSVLVFLSSILATAQIRRMLFSKFSVLLGRA
jgi:O-antigen/teichoic acid export membrane protein